uniref:Ovule protein n=1 Tax=Heterorhabditis bacteriophora TaxID=37862 RepID=A0A1I7X1M4_HETBA
MTQDGQKREWSAARIIIVPWAAYCSIYYILFLFCGLFVICSSVSVNYNLVFLLIIFHIMSCRVIKVIFPTRVLRMFIILIFVLLFRNKL